MEKSSLILLLIAIIVCLVGVLVVLLFDLNKTLKQKKDYREKAENAAMIIDLLAELERDPVISIEYNILFNICCTDINLVNPNSWYVQKIMNYFVEKIKISNVEEIGEISSMIDKLDMYGERNRALAVLFKKAIKKMTADHLSQIIIAGIQARALTFDRIGAEELVGRSVICEALMFIPDRSLALGLVKLLKERAAVEDGDSHGVFVAFEINKLISEFFQEINI